MIKASWRRRTGMRLVRDDSELVRLFQQQGEAEAAFGNPGLYLEKFIERPILNFKLWAIATATSSTWVSETAQSSVVPEAVRRSPQPSHSRTASKNGRCRRHGCQVTYYVGQARSSFYLLKTASSISWK